MSETIDTIIKWHTETFPDATLDGQLAKFEEEYNEWYKTEFDSEEELYETADMIIVSAGIARFDYAMGLDFLKSSLLKANNKSKLWQAVEKKMKKNRKRIWNKTADGQYHHENGIED